MEEENKDTIEKNEIVEISEANNEQIKIADDVVSIIAGWRICWRYFRSF